MSNNVNATKCEWCGKPFKPNSRGRPRKYCSNTCKNKAYREREKQKSLNIEEDMLLKYTQYMLEDNDLFWEDPEFNQNDLNWGLGESNLSEHKHGEKDMEEFYVHQEFERIFSRKPNP